MLTSFNCQILPLKLRCLQPPQDDLFQALFSALYVLKEKEDGYFALQNGDILFLSAKIVAIHQGRCIRLGSKAEHSALVRQEADFYIANTLLANESSIGPLDFPFTLKGQTPVPFAGIDESNGDGWHILWPENLEQTADMLHRAIALEYGVREFGLVITDSTVSPRRRGCVGISIAAFGLKLLDNYMGQRDLFGRELKLSENNIVDRLTSFATLFMGEGAEQTPVVILRGLGQFVSKTGDFSHLFIDREKDFFWPLFRASH